MTVQELNEQLESNMSEITRHNDLYFNQHSPEITDAEYDRLVKDTALIVKELEESDPNNEVVINGRELLSEVGAEPTYGAKVEHPSRMGSLTKASTVAELCNWFKGVGGAIVLMPKMDGLAIRLVYENGKLVLAATRGNGIIGQDVTANIKASESIPNEISYTGDLELRGEMFMQKSVFKELAESGERVFANPRNAASGSLMTKDPKITGRRKLSFRCYEISAESEEFETIEQMRGFVAENFKKIKWVSLERIGSSEEALEKKIEEWEKKRGTLDYEIDGLVIMSNSIETHEELGWTGKCPNAAIAYKFQAEQKESTVRNIYWHTGRIGRITPVVEIIPTHIDGSTVTNISLHNYKRICDLGLQIGDKVLFEKANDIIPQVIRVTDRHGRDKNAIPSENSINYPAKCPSCGAKTEKEGPAVVCVNAHCVAQAASRIEHYLNVLEVKGVGPSIIQLMLSEGIIKNIPDLYYISFDRLKGLSGWGDKSAEAVVSGILEKSDIPLGRFITALGLGGIGETVGKAIAKKFKTFANFRQATKEELKKIDGIGDTLAESIRNGLEVFESEIDSLLRCVDVQEVEEKTGGLTGSSFCLTGAMPSGRKRKDIEAEIESAGGDVKKGVSKGLTYLIMADPNSTSSKAQKAQKLGTKIISEEELMELMKV